LSKDELAGYYDGFSNATLWPLYHDAIRPPEYRRRWWHPYEEVNRRFADAAASAVSRNGIVWVHDYHLQLVPRMIRERRPDVKIGFFLHIPFPPQELFAQLPWRTQVLEGMLGSDVVGFQTAQGAQNFFQLCKRFVRCSGRSGDLQVGKRTCRVRSFPISIDTARFEGLAKSPEVEARALEIREKLGPDRRVILGVDRLDYTKGIDIRLRAFQDLLRRDSWDPSACVFVQVCVPSRERVEQYRDLKIRIESLIGQINGEFGEVGVTPVHYLHRSLPVEELVALYRSADVMVVTPFRDGMNLVAKEYVASRLDETGVLLLSEFAGTAQELRSALLVNPHDIDGLVQTLEDALTMPPGEQRQRIRSMRRIVEERDIYVWSRQFMEELRR
ncbi:MAG: trehalose-6-phosphate synthase, partial [Phycisphaerales bacterium]|nr:trehalose-6-phosphate synthase [Phycisphaerales bacterium]